MELTPGQVFEAQYRVQRRVGSTDAYTDYEARSEERLRNVTLRVFTAAGDAAQALVERARAVGQLEHPGIAQVYEAGLCDGAAWVAMEHVDGETLAQRMKWGRPLAPGEAVKIVDQLLSALEVAHAAGHLHGDLHGGRVLVERGTERVKIEGLGLAPPGPAIDGGGATAAALEVPLHAAPELALDPQRVGPAADLYGVGAILYELLSSQRPYDAATHGALVQQMQRRGPRPIQQAAPAVSPALAAVVDRLLAVDPAQRASSAAEVRASLQAALSAPAPEAGSASAPGLPRTVALDSASFAGPTPPPGEPAPPATPPPGGFGTLPQGGFGTPSPGGFGAPPPGGFGAPAGAATPPQGGFGSPAGGFGAPSQPQSGFGAPPAGTGLGPPPPGVAPPTPRSGASPLLIVGVLGGGCLALVAVFVVAGAVLGLVVANRASEEVIVEPMPAPVPAPMLAPGGVSVSSLGLPGASAERVRIATDDAPARGGAEPLVTIVVFSDFECPFCQRVEPTISQLQATYGDRVRYVWRDNPLSFHTHALTAAEAAREAYVQGGDDRFWALHAILFENQRALERPSLERYAAAAGVDVTRLRAALDARTHHARVQADMNAARTAGARGTPTFYLNGRRLGGAQPYERFREVVDEEIALAEELMRRGTPRSALYATFQRDAVTTGTQDPPSTPAPREPDTARHTLTVPSDAPTLGPASAPVTIHVFSDFQCPFCARVEPTLAQVRAAYGQRVRLVWRHYPLAFHQRAMPASIAAIEVQRQAGDAAFWRYHDILFENRTALEDEDLVRYASRVPGVNPAEVRAAIQTQRHRARVQADMDAGQALDSRLGTPTFYINGVQLRGAQPFSQFQQRIDAEL